MKHTPCVCGAFATSDFERLTQPPPITDFLKITHICLNYLYIYFKYINTLKLLYYYNIMYTINKNIIDILEQGDIDIDYINKTASLDICRAFINLLQNTKNIDDTINETFIKQRLNTDYLKKEENLNSIIESKNIIIQQLEEDNKKHFNRTTQDIEKLSQEKNKDLDRMSQEKNKDLDRMSQENNRQIDRMTQELTRMGNIISDLYKQRDKDHDRFTQEINRLQDINDTKLKQSNTDKGLIGEDLVFNSLSNYNNYDDLELIKVANEKGSGDLIALSKKYDINIMIEVKNSPFCTPRPQLEVFIEHYTDYFLSHNNSHAIILSLNYHKFTGKGSYKIEPIVVNDKTHYVMYLARRNMSEDYIRENFNTFIDYIKIHSKISEYNNINLLKQLEQSNNVLQSNIDDWDSKKKYYLSEIDKINKIIEKLMKTMEYNKKQMDEHNFFHNYSSYEIYTDVINILHNKNVDMSTFDLFKKSLKIAGFKDKKMLIEITNAFEKKVKSKSYEDIYDILLQYNKSVL